MAFVAQFFVCRVVVANYYWSLMISAVAALDPKPVMPLSCHLGENGSMTMFDVGYVSYLLQPGVLELQSGAESCCCQYVLLLMSLCMQTWHYYSWHMALPAQRRNMPAGQACTDACHVTVAQNSRLVSVQLTIPRVSLLTPLMSPEDRHGNLVQVWQLMLQAWAWGGIAVYGVLSGLNLFWFYKLMLLALQGSSKQQPKTLTPALQPSPIAAAVTAITATSVQAVAAAADAASCVSTSITKAKPLRQRSKQVLADWLHSSKQKAAAVSGFSSSTLPGLQSRLSECLDSPDSPRIGAAHAFGRAVSTLGPAVVDGLGERAAAAESKGWARASSWAGGVRPPVSPFAALADREWAGDSKGMASDLGSALQTDWHHHSWKSRLQSPKASLAKAIMSEFGPAALAQWELHQSSSEGFGGVRSGLTANLSGLGPAVLADLEIHQSSLATLESARSETARAAISQFGPAFIDEWTARASVDLSSSSSSQTESVVASIKGVGSGFGPAVVDGWDARRSLDCSPQSLSPRAVVAGLKLAGSGFGPAVLAGLEQRQSSESIKLSKTHMKVC